ncbi:MAG: hypothetical protein HOE78_03350 [Gammaproteobacteria bacterium]|nr:hypothetical protein [Gammaproteobacteria bacterium]
MTRSKKLQPVVKHVDKNEQSALKAVAISQQLLQQHLNQLQQLHQAITQEELDKRNFRKKVVRDKLVEATDEKQDNVLHKPARLYRIKV